MPTTSDIIAEIDARVTESLMLGVGRIADGDVETRHLALDEDAADALRELCVQARDRIDRAESVDYTATAEISSDEYFVIDDADSLGELSDFWTLAEEVGSLPTIAPSDLDLTLRFYAVVIGDGDKRVMFVRRTNPTVTHRAGRFFATARERVSRIDGPVFSFAADFDFVLGPTWAVVLKQHSFEQLFREAGLVEKHISTWIEGITKHLPMESASVEALREVALRDSRTWRRLRDIERRGHLADIDLAAVKEYAIEVELDPDKIVVDGKLVFDPSDRFGFLHLLAEDLFTGRLTGETFESQRKSAVE